MIAIAALMALPMMVPFGACAQATGVKPPLSPTNPEPPARSGIKGAIIYEYHAVKLPGTFRLLGEGDGHTIFRAPDGAAFHLDPGTGAKIPVAAGYFRRARAAVFKHTGESTVSIVGADTHGNTVMKDARSATFILDPKSGRQVFIKWPK